METGNSPVFYRPRKEDSFFRRKHNTTIALAVAVLLFLLPFAELRCTSYTLARNSGLGLALGDEWKSVALGDMKDLMESMPDKKGSKEELSKSMRDSPNIFAIGAIIAGISGLLFAFMRGKSTALVQMCAGILGALLLVGLLVQLKLQLKSQLSSGKKGDGFAGSAAFNSIIVLRFTIWYYVSLLSFAVAAFFAYKRHRISFEDDLRNAHQFDFQNSRPTVTDTNDNV